MITLELTKDEFKMLWVFCSTLKAMTSKNLQTPAISTLLDKVRALGEKVL